MLAVFQTPGNKVDVDSCRHLKASPVYYQVVVELGIVFLDPDIIRGEVIIFKVAKSNLVLEVARRSRRLLRNDRNSASPSIIKVIAEHILDWSCEVTEWYAVGDEPLDWRNLLELQWMRMIMRAYYTHV